MNEIERSIKRKCYLDKIEKELEKRRNEFYIKQNEISSDISLSYDERKKACFDLRVEYLNYFDDMQIKIANIDEIIDEENIEEEKETEVKEEERKFKFFPDMIPLAILGSLIGATFIVGYKINKGNIAINDKTISYSKELENVIDNTTYKEYENNNLVTKIDYSQVANYIENSDNPDLALYTLYKDYGKCGIKKYNGITSKVCDELDFDYRGTELNGNFKDYVTLNGYSDYVEYYKACSKELINDEDDTLDNLTVKIRTKKIER